MQKYQEMTKEELLAEGRKNKGREVYFVAKRRYSTRTRGSIRTFEKVLRIFTS